MEFVKLVGPFGTIFIMFALGLNLTIKDFILTIKKPNNLIVGLFSQLLILPLIGLILVKIYPMRDEFQLNGLPKRKSYLSSVHLFGSCPIGENKKLNKEICVANSYGKLNNYENIYLADASIIPEALGVNPQATVMGLSYRVADYFLNSI